MSEFIVTIRARPKVATSLALAAAVYVSSAAAQSPERDSNLQLVRSLKSAVEAIESLPAFDVGGVTIHSEDFDDGKTPVVETNRFRMQISHDRELLRYIVETRSSTPSAAGNVKAGEAVTSSILITDETVERSNAVNGIEQYASVDEFRSFQEALASGGAPPPGYWGLRSFPIYPDHLKGLYSLIEKISEGNATVTSETGDDTIHYAARIGIEPGVRSTITHWEFKLPTYLPTFHKVESATKGKNTTVGEQNVDYRIIDGHEVPNVIRSWVAAVKREPDGYRLGKKHRVTKFKWLRIAEDAVEERPEHLTKPEQIGSFLAEAPPIVPLDVDTK